MARSSHPTDFSNSSDSSDESSVDYSLISKSELTDRSLLPTRSDPKDKRFDSQVIFQENSQKNSSLEYGDTSDSEISKIDSSSKAVKRKSVDHCNMKPSFEKETPIPVFYESSTDDSENELLPRSIQTNRRSSTRIRNSADPGSMPNKKIDSEKSKEDEKVVDNGPMKDYKFYFNHYPSSCVKEDILDSFARNSNRQRMTLQPFKRVKTSNKPEPGRKSNWGMPGVTKYRTTSKMVPMKFAPQMMEIDWNHVNLGSADYLFTTEKEKELERSASKYNYK
ncbi:hypothetical protein G6F56_012608 [Rhizopus delemar]|nr:hypothetical protein G6F56_012608 [Rhizopus delemar]